MTWLKSHALEFTIFISQIFGVVIAAAIAWGVLSTRVEAHTERIDRYEGKLDQAIKLLERIDERTKKL